MRTRVINTNDIKECMKDRKFQFKTNIKQRYLMNEKISEIAKSENCNPETIRRYFKRNRIALRPSLYLSVSEFIPSNLSEKEWIYITGLFDGEGCLYKTKSKMWILVIANTNLEVIEWLHTKISGSAVYKKWKIYKGTQHRTLYWQINRQKGVLWFLKNIQPYAIIKREKINQAISELNVIKI
jgi:intein-encoded DNA endonuclease-like protein